MFIVRVALTVLLFLVSPSLFSQESTYDVTYIKANSYTSPSINITSIDDFLKLMKNFNTREVFVTNTLFIIQAPSIFYTINTNGYKNLQDYKKGVDGHFANSQSYYFALENNLTTQEEVEYYKSEAFLTNIDYQRAIKLGFARSSIGKKGIYGLISPESFQENIKHLDAVIFLMFYKDWVGIEPPPSTAVQNTVIISSGKNATEQQRIREIQQRKQKEVDGRPVLENTSISTILEAANKERAGMITKLQHFDYYLINIPVKSGQFSIPDEASKDCVFYYMCEFCQFSDISDYEKNSSPFTLKETQAILNRYAFSKLDDMLDADKANIRNGTNYALMYEYQITQEQLNENKELIDSLESIKTKYLGEVKDASYYSGSRLRPSEIGSRPYSHSNKAGNKSMLAFAVYTLLKQPKTIPVTYSGFIQTVQSNYGDLTIFRNIAFTESQVSGVLELDGIKEMVVNNNSNRSFYLK